MTSEKRGYTATVELAEGGREKEEVWREGLKEGRKGRRDEETVSLSLIVMRRFRETWRDVYERLGRVEMEETRLTM